jgi:hypothetical protein
MTMFKTERPLGLGVLGNIDSDEIREAPVGASRILRRTYARKRWSDWAKEKTSVCFPCSWLDWSNLKFRSG